MRTRFFLTILLVILFHCLVSAQISNERLRENCLNDANYWKEILSLTDSEIEKMSNVLFTYHSSVRDLPKDISNYRTKLEDIERRKLQDLNGLLGSRRFKTYTMINESAEDFISEMFFEIKNAMQRDSALIREASMQIRSRYPVLIHYHQELMNQMSEEDYFELKNIKKRMFHKLDSLNNLNINIVDTIYSQKELPSDAKANLIAISNIIKNYDEEYQKVYVLLLEHQQRWDREMEQIFLRHYPESNLNSMKEYGMFFQRTGIKKELDKMLIYMLDPEDKSRYFQVLMIIQKVEEQIFEIHK